MLEFLHQETWGKEASLTPKHQLMRSSPLSQKPLSEKHKLLFEDWVYFIHYSVAEKTKQNKNIKQTKGQKNLVASHRSALVFLNVRSHPQEFLLTLLAVSKNLLASAGLLSLVKGFCLL